MKEFIVTLVANDGHIVKYTINADTEDSAINKAMSKINEAGWAHYEYQLKQLERTK